MNRRQAVGAAALALLLGVGAGLNGQTRGGQAMDEWKWLFQGGSTDAFRAFRGNDFPDSWTVEGDALKTIPGRSRVDLVTREMFSDFIFEFEWKVSPAGNSGVMYGVSEAASATHMTGPEYQVLDDTGHRDGQDPKTSAGSLYGLVAPEAGAKILRPVGEYNSGRIVVQGDRVEHWLNGRRVLAYRWGSPEIRKLIDESKFRQWPGFMQERRGHISLQHHGEEVWYRNIRVRALPPRES